MGHAMQFLMVVLLLTLEYVPAIHCSHTDEPFCDEYDPRGHGAHVADDVAFNTVLYVPAAHGIHDDSDEAPSDMPYVPAGHGLAIPPGQ